MLKILLVLTLLFSVSQGVSATDKKMPSSHCPLTGTWQSDKQKTMPALAQSDNIPADVKARMANLLGKVSIRYNKSCTQAVANVNGKQSTLNFEVLSNDKGSITVKDTQTHSQHLMRFEGDCYLMEVQGIGVDEYYCRVEGKK